MTETDQLTRPLVTLADVGSVGRILATGLAAWCVPEGRWRPLSEAVARRAQPSPERRAAIDRFLDRQGFEADATAIYRDALAAQIESHLQLLRARRPGGWHPRTRVVGIAHAEDALARGRGAVIWLPISAAYSLGAKIAMEAAGLRPSHISHPRHGFSRSRVGVRILNPIRTGVEDRYLQSRIMLGWDGAVDAWREALRRLRANEIVSITAGSDAQSLVTVPFLGAELEIAGGAPALAFAANSVLLPAFPVNERDGSVSVTIRALRSRGRDESKGQFVDRCAVEFARLLGEEVRRHPAQWLGWLYATPPTGTL